MRTVFWSILCSLRNRIPFCDRGNNLIDIFNVIFLNFGLLSKSLAQDILYKPDSSGKATSKLGTTLKLDLLLGVV